LICRGIKPSILYEVRCDCYGRNDQKQKRRGTYLNCFEVLAYHMEQ